MKINKPLEEELDKQFPKGDKSRGKALVINAVAHIEIKKLKAQHEKELDDLGEQIANMNKEMLKVEKENQELKEANKHLKECWKERTDEWKRKEDELKKELEDFKEYHEDTIDFQLNCQITLNKRLTDYKAKVLEIIDNKLEKIKFYKQSKIAIKVLEELKQKLKEQGK